MRNLEVNNHIASDVKLLGNYQENVDLHPGKCSAFTIKRTGLNLHKLV